MIARQFVLSSSSFFSDTLPSQHSSFSTLFELDGLYHRAHRSQHPSLPTLFVLNTLRARWFVPSSSSFSTLIVLNTHRFQHSSLPTLIASNTLRSQHSSSSMVCTIELIVLNTHRFQHSSQHSSLSTLFVINTLRAHHSNTLLLAPRPHFRLCNTPRTRQTSDFNTLRVRWFVPSSSSFSILCVWYLGLTFDSATRPRTRQSSNDTPSMDS
jgi:hypothetical protein